MGKKTNVHLSSELVMHESHGYMDCIELNLTHCISMESIGRTNKLIPRIMNKLESVNGNNTNSGRCLEQPKSNIRGFLVLI